MSITTVSSREFNRDTSRAKKAAKGGPVFITDRGKPAHVLLTIDDYRLLRQGRSLADLLEQLSHDDSDFEPARMRDGWLNLRPPHSFMG